MAVCKVLRSTGGWNKGDDVELFGDRLLELAREGVVEIVIPDAVVDEPVKEVVKEVVRPIKKRIRKGVN